MMNRSIVTTEVAVCFTTLCILIGTGGGGAGETVRRIAAGVRLIAVGVISAPQTFPNVTEGKGSALGELLDVPQLVQQERVTVLPAVPTHLRLLRDRYDPARGYAFSSFAVPTIAGELKRHFRDQTWMVRPPRGIQEVTLRVEGALTRLSQQLDRSPTTSELADAVGVSDEEILEAMQARSARGALSLHAPQGEPGDGMSLQDTLGADDPDIERAETRAQLDRLMAEVSPRAREMLRMRFEEDMTQAEIGAAIGISQMQVSRILRQTIAKLREVAEQEATPAPAGASSGP